MPSLSSWRAWIEICYWISVSMLLSGRSPHGERGLKCAGLGRHVEAFVSLSSWRAWIEIARRPASMPSNRRSLSSWRAWIEIVPCPASGRVGPGRSPHGERGLKLRCSQTAELLESCRSPHGERGLKFDQAHVAGGIAGRSPHGERGLKLIVQPCLACPMRGRSPHGERGLKLQMTNVLSDEALSLSSWRAWIEIGND